MITKKRTAEPDCVPSREPTTQNCGLILTHVRGRTALAATSGAAGNLGGAHSAGGGLNNIIRRLSMADTTYTLPDVEPWYDTEDEGVYSDDPEDGYPYDE